MRFLIFIFLLCSFENSFSQCAGFQFAEIGYEPAHCRIAGYQSGNGVVYAAATGGTEPYSYQWTNLQTGQTSINTTWGGLNPGEYKISVVDSIGCTLTEIVKVDSIIPQANFEISFIDIDTSLAGQLSAEIMFINTSNDYYAASPWPPDTNYFWNSNDSSVWTPAYFEDTYGVEITQAGLYEICLAARNKNNCVDTLCQSFSITPPVFENECADIYYSSVTGEVSIELLIAEPVLFILANVNGAIPAQFLLEPGINSFQLDPGIYYYQLVNTQTNESMCSGTIAILG